MKTIKQIASEIGVSKQAIEKRLYRVPFKDSINAHISKDGRGVKLIDQIGERLIKAAYNVIDKPMENTGHTGTGKSIEVSMSTIDTLVSILQGELEKSKNELDIKNEQIARLNEALLNAQREAYSAQVLHLADKREILSPEKEKVGFLAGLFKKKS